MRNIANALIQAAIVAGFPQLSGCAGAHADAHRQRQTMHHGDCRPSHGGSGESPQAADHSAHGAVQSTASASSAPGADVTSSAGKGACQ